MSFRQLSCITELVNPKTSLLSFIIEIHSINSPGVKYIMQTIKYLRAVYVSQEHCFIPSSFQCFSRNNRFKICKEWSLAGFHIATRYGIMCHQDRCFMAFSSKPHYHTGYVTCPCFVFFICRQTRESWSELLLIKSRNAGYISIWSTEYSWRCYYMYISSICKHLAQNSELTTSVMVRCSSHYNHCFRNTCQFCDRVCCNNHFVWVSCRTYLLLMENITRNANNVWFLFFCNLNHIIKTIYCILWTEIHSVHYRTFELANMPVSCM